MDDEYKDEGYISKQEYGDVYEIKLVNGKITRRHSSQQRLLERGKL